MSSRVVARSRPVTHLPRWIWVPFTLATLMVVLPLVGLLVRGAPADPHPAGAIEGARPADDRVEALRLSLLTCVASTGVVVAVGVPTAVLLARSHGRWVPVVRVAFTLPMVLPPVVAGLTLLVTFGRHGLVGQPLAVLGLEIGFTTVAVMMAQVFVSLPFLVISLEGALRATPRGHEAVAAGLGASPTRVLWRITLPMAAPAVASSTALAFGRALGEFGATLTFAGSVQGVTRTMPLEIYLVRELDTDSALALSLVLVLVAVAVVGVAAATRTWRTDA